MPLFKRAPREDVCPVCSGTGWLEKYARKVVNGKVSVMWKHERCKTCGGTGKLTY